jgi:diaminopimelate decarboxylase
VRFEMLLEPGRVIVPFALVLADKVSCSIFLRFALIF